MVGILVYALIGLVVGAVARFTTGEASSMVGMLGTGGAGGVAGGVLANLLVSGTIAFDWYGVAGSAILALVAVLVVRSVDRGEALQTTVDTTTETPPDV